MIKATEITLIDIEKIVPNPGNPNKHPKKQINHLAKQIKYQGFRNPLIISNQSGLLVVGHGRLEAAKQAGLKKIPVIYQDFETPDQEFAFMVAENATQHWSELDLPKINLEIPHLHPDFNIEMLGIDGFTLDFSEKNLPNDKYSKKIDAPTYEPKKETAPDIEELYSLDKFDSLVNEIKELDIPKKLKTFLVHAATRHIVFNYENIAEFYCHQSKEVQNLMENSALVIIDFDKAIENGFVKLTAELQNLSENNEADDE